MAVEFGELGLGCAVYGSRDSDSLASLKWSGGGRSGGSSPDDESGRGGWSEKSVSVGEYATLLPSAVLLGEERRGSGREGVKGVLVRSSGVVGRSFGVLGRCSGASHESGSAGDAEEGVAPEEGGSGGGAEGASEAAKPAQSTAATARLFVLRRLALRHARSSCNKPLTSGLGGEEERARPFAGNWSGEVQGLLSGRGEGQG